MKRNRTTTVVLALLLAGLVALGAEATPEDSLDRFGPNPFDVRTPSGISVPVSVIARFGESGPSYQGDYISGVTVVLTSLDHGQPQSLTTRGGPPIQDQFEAVAGQTYAVTASYGASTASTVVTITSFGDPAVLLFGRPSEPSGGHLLMTIRPGDGAIVHLGYHVVHGSLTPDPRMALPTPTGTPVRVLIRGYYLDRASGLMAGPVVGLHVEVISGSQVVPAAVTDEFGFVGRPEDPVKLLAGHEYTVLVEWKGQSTAADILVTSIGPSQTYALGGVISIQVDLVDDSIIDIGYEMRGAA